MLMSAVVMMKARMIYKTSGNSEIEDDSDNLELQESGDSDQEANNDGEELERREGAG